MDEKQMIEMANRQAQNINQFMAYTIMNREGVTFEEAMKIAKAVAYRYFELRKAERRNK